MRLIVDVRALVPVPGGPGVDAVAVLTIAVPSALVAVAVLPAHTTPYTSNTGGCGSNDGVNAQEHNAAQAAIASARVPDTHKLN